MFVAGQVVELSRPPRSSRRRVCPARAGGQLAAGADGRRCVAQDVPQGRQVRYGRYLCSKFGKCGALGTAGADSGSSFLRGRTGAIPPPASVLMCRLLRRLKTATAPIAEASTGAPFLPLPPIDQAKQQCSDCSSPKARATVCSLLGARPARLLDPKSPLFAAVLIFD